ncbi:MAG: hypothetical protein Q7Q71_06450 [Verrucomicrobiota bacterium JB023]|nr:hypothetical protein [Verrucomicrobiota bacterium JB023]
MILNARAGSRGNLDQTVLSIPDEGGIAGPGGKRAVDEITIIVIGGGAEKDVIGGGVLVEGVGDVVGGGRKRQGVCSFLAISAGIVLVGTVVTRGAGVIKVCPLIVLVAGEPVKTTESWKKFPSLAQFWVKRSR